MKNNENFLSKKEHTFLCQALRDYYYNKSPYKMEDSIRIGKEGDLMDFLRLGSLLVRAFEEDSYLSLYVVNPQDGEVYAKMLSPYTLRVEGGHVLKVDGKPGPWFARLRTEMKVLRKKANLNLAYWESERMKFYEIIEQNKKEVDRLAREVFL